MIEDFTYIVLIQYKDKVTLFVEIFDDRYKMMAFVNKLPEATIGDIKIVTPGMIAEPVRKMNGQFFVNI